MLARMPGETARRIARMVDAAGHGDPAMRMALLLTMETLRDPPSALLREDAAARLAADTDPFLSYRNCARRFAAEEPVQQMLLTDICLQLPSQFLPKVDRATMALGIEARVPLLDDRVASLAVGLPAALKVRGAGKKIVLREAMRGRVPDEILDGPKTGFGVPYARWLRGPLREFARARILDAKFLERHEFDAQRVARAFDEHVSGRRDRGFLVWKLLQLALWSRRAAETH
jgi:asparagine synthase (glutamine-hydrolysing)